MIGHVGMASTETPATAAQLISKAIIDRQPLTALIGPHGSGKANVMAVVMQSLADRPISFVRIGNPSGKPLSSNGLLAQICDESDAEHDPDAASRIMHALRGRGGSHTVLVVEQAETLLPPSIRLLHLLTRASDPTLKPVQVVFVGTEAFRELLQEQSFAVLRAQLATVVVLPALTDMPPPSVIPIASGARMPSVPRVAMRTRGAAVKARRSPRRLVPVLAAAGATMLAALVYAGGIGYPRFTPSAPSQIGQSTSDRPASTRPTTTRPTTTQPTAPQPAMPSSAALQPTTAGVAQPPANAPTAMTVAPAAAAPTTVLRPAPPAAAPPRIVTAPDAGPHVLPSISPAMRRQLRQSFDAFLRQGRAEVAGLSSAQRDQLFEQYLANYLAQEQTRAGTAQPAALPNPDPPTAAPPRNDAAANTHRVVIHYKSTSDAARTAAARMSSVLDTTTARTELRPVDSVPLRPAIRYYSAEDREAARRLAATLAAERNQPEVDWIVQDFSSFRPLPPPGTLEVWLPPS